MAKIIGVDLGSANSAAAFTRKVGSHLRTDMLPSRYGRTQQGMVFPSYVRFTSDGKVDLVGEEARQAMAASPRRVVWGVKRLIGRTYSQLTAEDRARFPFPIAKGENNEILIPMGEKTYSPEDVSSILLETMRGAAEDTSIPGNLVAGSTEGAVVTRPAYFDTVQTQATRDAARRAGFPSVTIISEPEAAALSHGVELAERGETSFVMTIDWGAGTLDVVASVLAEHPSEDTQLFESVCPPYGDASLGGIDMDDALIAEAIEVGGLGELQDVLDIMRSDPAGLTPEHDDALRTLAGLRLAIEQVKIDLAVVPFKETYIQVRRQPFRLKMARTPRDVPSGERDWIILDRAIGPLLERFRECVQKSLTFAGLAATDVSHMLLVGGPMKMPSVRAVVAEIFDSNRAVSAQLAAIEASGDFSVDPMECVARGASLWAVRDELGDIRVQKPQLSRAYGVMVGGSGLVQGGEILLPRGSTAPCDGTLALGTPGSPGDAIDFSLAAIQMDGDEWHTMGKNAFYPTFLDGRASFKILLEADREEVVDVSLTDARTGEKLTLDRANRLSVGPVSQPEAFGEVDEPELGGGGGAAAPPSAPLPVPAAKVSEARNEAMACLAFARGALSDGTVSDSTKDELSAAVADLEEGLAALPEGVAPQVLYTRTRNRCTKLRYCLRSAGLLSSETEGVS